MDRICKNLTTTFSKQNPLPLVALASFPNSGNTWIRYIIEGITGIFTGSFYMHEPMIRKGIWKVGSLSTIPKRILYYLFAKSIF